MTSTLIPTHSGTRISARVPAAGRRRFPFAMALAAEVGLMGVIFVAYRQVRFLTKGDTAQAMDNASTVIAFEERLHVFTEHAVQRLVLHSELLISFLNRYYVGVHFPATIAFLVWAFCRHRSSYGRIRVWFVSVTLAALAIHVAMPLAPPRMIASQGFVDTLQVYGPSIYSTDTSRSVANQFAAMPSLHFGWAALVALSFIMIKRNRRSLLILAHPAITLLAIVATANHYWLDAAVALVLVVVAGLLIRRFMASPTSEQAEMQTQVPAGEPAGELAPAAVSLER